MDKRQRTATIFKELEPDQAEGDLSSDICGTTERPCGQGCQRNAWEVVRRERMTEMERVLKESLLALEGELAAKLHRQERWHSGQQTLMRHLQIVLPLQTDKTKGISI